MPQGVEFCELIERYLQADPPRVHSWASHLLLDRVFAGDLNKPVCASPAGLGGEASVSDVRLNGEPGQPTYTGASTFAWLKAKPSKRNRLSACLSAGHQIGKGPGTAFYFLSPSPPFLLPLRPAKMLLCPGSSGTIA